MLKRGLRMVCSGRLIRWSARDLPPTRRGGLSPNAASFRGAADMLGVGANEQRRFSGLKNGRWLCTSPAFETTAGAGGICRGVYG